MNYLKMLLLLFAAALYSNQAQAQMVKRPSVENKKQTLDQEERAALEHTVVTLTPMELPEIQGQPIDDLSVMVWNGEHFIPIPFQIDEMDSFDLVWFVENNFDRQGKEGLFDGADQLLVMLRDGGTAAPVEQQPAQGQIIAVVTLATPQQTDHTFYLVSGNSQRDGYHYVSHDPRTGVTRTERYILATDPGNELNWRHLGYTDYRGRADASLINSLKMNMSGGVFFRFPRMSLDNNNLRPTMTGFHIGPIRSVMHLETRVVFAGLPMMKLHVQAHRYANHFEAHTYAKIPGLYRSALKRPQVAVSIDGNNLLGSVVRTARSKELAAKVDGKISADEKELIRRGLSSDESWILFDSLKGFALLTELDVPPQLRGIPLELIYEDQRDAKIPPEQLSGQLPTLGYELNGWPEQDELRFAVRLLFDQHLGGLAPPDYVALRTGRALQISVSYPAAAQ